MGFGDETVSVWKVMRSNWDGEDGKFIYGKNDESEIWIWLLGDFENRFGSETFLLYEFSFVFVFVYSNLWHQQIKRLFKKKKKYSGGRDD